MFITTLLKPCPNTGVPYTTKRFYWLGNTVLLLERCLVHIPTNTLAVLAEIFSFNSDTFWDTTSTETADESFHAHAELLFTYRLTIPQYVVRSSGSVTK